MDQDISIIESLSRSHLQIHPERHLSIKPLSQGASNKLYAISTSGPGDVEFEFPYIFRVTLPVEPFYKTASEVATLDYIRKHTSVPVPKVIAYSSTADNELGFEWILIEKVRGASLEVEWRKMNMEEKDRTTRAVARYVKQLRDQCSFDVIGSLYFREDLLDRKVHTVPTADDRFVIGPIVIALMFVGGRKPRLSRNLGPYSDDGEYVTALTNVEVEDAKFLLPSKVRTQPNFYEHLMKEAPEVAEGLEALEKAQETLFPSRPRPPRSFTLSHRDLSLSNIYVNRATHAVTGIVDWECTGTRPFWERRYPVFLEGREIKEKPEPLSSGKDDPARAECWEGWEKSVLKRSWDEELGNVDHGDDATDKVRLEWRRDLDWVENYVEKLMQNKESV